MSTLSRRRLLALAALAAANVPALVPFASPAAASDASAYQDAFRAALDADPDIRRGSGPSGEFLYRPQQLLTANGDASRVATRLSEMGYQVTPSGGFAGVTRLAFGREVDVPSIVDLLRDPKRWSTAAPAVQPHHVTVGFGNIMGNPDGPPSVAGTLPGPDPARLGEGAGVLVGLCDTGIWRDADVFHKDWFGNSYVPDDSEVDDLYLYGDVLALEGGHGTFVAGVLCETAPGVSFEPHHALHPSGTGDEEMLVAAMAAAGQRASILNLSLGCYTQGDVPSLPIANALAALPADVLVVAAAGNSASDRPTWPAAFPDVVAVAGLADSGLPASYSNFGVWVDACARGDWVSTYVPGSLLLPSGLPVVFGGYARWSGTSFAAPVVAGRLARIVGSQGLTPPEARSKLLGSGPGTGEPNYGVIVD